MIPPPTAVMNPQTITPKTSKCAATPAAAPSIANSSVAARSQPRTRSSLRRRVAIGGILTSRR